MKTHPRSRVLLCAGLAACLLPAPAESQPVDTFGWSTRYLAIVARYAAGEHAAAVAALGDWTEKDLRDQLAGVNRAAQLVQRCASPTYLARHAKADAFAAIAEAMGQRYLLRYEPQRVARPGWHCARCRSTARTTR